MAYKDIATQQTDDILEELEKKIAQEYKMAYKDMSAKYKAYMDSMKAADAKQKALLDAGKITDKEYKDWRMRHVAMGKRWDEMKKTIAEDMHHTNEIAQSVYKGYMPEVYALNHNYSVYAIQKQGNCQFAYTMYNAPAVERLWRENPKLLPDPRPGSATALKIAANKDLAWNMNQVQSSIVQSILQGESMDQAAKRLEEVTEKNFNAAVRNARTAITGAQNAGRTDSYKYAESKGVKVRRKWRAILDDKTRHSHRLLDGMIVGVDEPWEIEGEEIMHPGDPYCEDPSLIYNCRCTEEPVIDGYDGGHVTHSDVMKEMTYDEWKYKDKDDKKEHLQDIAGQLGKKMDKLKENEYSGIWYNQTVTPADYESKKGSIQSKKEYYEKQIKAGVDPAKEAQYEQYLKDLENFEKQGKQYSEYQKELSETNKEIKQITKEQMESGEISTNDIFSQERKDNALWFDAAAGGFRAADKYFDPPAIEVHDNATRAEHGAFYRYTQGSGPYNRPLAGYEKPYAEYGSGWEEKFYKGSGNVWIDYEGQGDNIRRLTELIEKSTYDQDIWLQSEQDEQTMEGLLGLPRGTIARMTDAQLENELVGQRFEIPQFLSTAVNEGGGSVFNSKPTKWNIFVPEGSEVLYASDRGAFGKGENEMILQRGGTYEITKAYWGIDATDYNRRKIFFDVDLHSELGYNKFQQDPNEWTGSRVKGR